MCLDVRCETVYPVMNVILTGGFEKDSCKLRVKSVNNLSRHYYTSNKWSLITPRLSSSITGNAWANKAIFPPLRGLQCKSCFGFFISLVESFVAWVKIRGKDYCVKLFNNSTQLRANLQPLIIKTTKAIYHLYKMCSA